MYDPGALTMIPGKTTCPVIVNHDANRLVGEVSSLIRWDDETGPWLAAIRTIHDAPVWLSKETRVSFGYKPAGTSSDVFGCEIARRGLVDEVSLLAPDRKPAEPLARVVTLRRSVPAEAYLAAADVSPAPRRVSRERLEIDEFRRRLDAAGPNADFERIHAAMMFEYGYTHALAPVGWRRRLAA